jgi:hypothetical protein
MRSCPFGLGGGAVCRPIVDDEGLLDLVRHRPHHLPDSARFIITRRNGEHSHHRRTYHLDSFL